VTDHTRDEEIAALRDALAEQMGRNVELGQRIEALERERNELGVDEVARSLVRVAAAAEAGMVEAADDEGAGVRYVIPRLDVEMRGIVGRRGDGFGIRFPSPGGPIVAPALSTVSMSVAHVPAPPVDRALEGFRAGLEAVQASLARWDRDRGRAGAGDIVAQATRLLNLRSSWGDAMTVAGIGAMAEAIGRFDAQARSELAPVARDRLVASARALAVLARRMSDAGQGAPADLAETGSVLADLADAISAATRP
jgi:hypothetical protein